MRFPTFIVALLCIATSAAAQNRAEDEYTRYELLAPETSSFKIIYDVTAVTPGATFYFNPIRKGSIASDESVIDLASGGPLKFEQISGAAAREAGLASADLEGEYIKVTLARPVPAGGEARIRIIKTYKDPKSYYRDGHAIVFDRSLGIKRNAVVLPPKYELVSCNIPSQILEERDGRVGISFWNTYPASAPLVLRARPIAATTSSAAPAPGGTSNRASSPVPAAAAAARETPMNRITVSERAFQDREIVYFLNDPATHSFSLYHDYTEKREGVDKYLNVVRRGSTVSNPSAKNLDTGESLKVETLKGEAISKAAIDIGEAILPDTEVVVIRFPPVKKGQSIRLRIEETYTDPARYAVIDGQLMWHRTFGRPKNDIVLPAGWRVTTSSIPALVSLTDDGRVRLAYVNPRPDSIDVFVKARHAGQVRDEVRPGVFRTPDERFQNLPGFEFAPHYMDVNGYRVHYLDEGPRDGRPVLLLHGEPTWSYLYRKMIPIIAAAGFRVIVPDLIGFGRSDKPADRDIHTYAFHVEAIATLVRKLDLRGATFFGQDWGGLIGLRVVAENGDRFAAVVVSNTALPTGDGPLPEAFEKWKQANLAMIARGDMPVGTIVAQAVGNPALAAAYDAPFPDPRFKAGPLILPQRVPVTPDDPARPANVAAWEVFRRWRKPFVTAFGDRDPITAGRDRPFQELVPGAKGQPHRTLAGAGHFIQETHAAELAQVIIDVSRAAR